MSKESSFPILQSALVDLIDLSLLAKQAHWNVKGKNFRSVHLELDEINDELHTYQDDVAERMAALGAVPDGTSGTIAKTSSVESLPIAFIQANDVVKGFTDRVTAVARKIESKLPELDNDMPSQDLLIGIVSGLDKSAWMFRSQTE
jgi:starvation-inducible DNA-binding protein